MSFAVSRIVQYGADCIFDALKHLLHDNRADGTEGAGSGWVGGEKGPSHSHVLALIEAKSFFLI